MTKATLSNSFHQTETCVIVPDSIAAQGQVEVWQYIEHRAYRFDATPADKARARRVQKALCGYRDCKCGIVR